MICADRAQLSRLSTLSGTVLRAGCTRIKVSYICFGFLTAPVRADGVAAGDRLTGAGGNDERLGEVTESSRERVFWPATSVVLGHFKHDQAPVPIQPKNQRRAGAGGCHRSSL
jgi:hypothetical protein